MTQSLACASAPARALACEYKRATATVADISSDGLFEGYASLFGVADLGGDIIERGAFRDTLDKRGAPGIRMLWQHDQAEPIGAWLSVEEDARGLKVRGKLDLAVARAREALALLKSGALDGLSIGFRAERATKGAAGQRLLHKIDLWEISLVTFPMAPRARVTSVKFFPRSRAERILPGTLAARRTDLHIKYLRLRSMAAALRLEMELKRASFRQALEERYSPDQPRVPGGSGRESGRWSGGAGGGDTAPVAAAAGAAALKPVQLAMGPRDPNVLNDTSAMTIPSSGGQSSTPNADWAWPIFGASGDTPPTGALPTVGMSINTATGIQGDRYQAADGTDFTVLTQRDPPSGGAATPAIVAPADAPTAVQPAFLPAVPAVIESAAAIYEIYSGWIAAGTLVYGAMAGASAVIAVRGVDSQNVAEPKDAAVGIVGEDRVNERCPSYFALSADAQSVAASVQSADPGLSNSQFGTEAHYQMKQQIEALNNPNLTAEYTVNSGFPAVYGEAGSKRFDIFEWDDANRGLCVYDIFTGDGQKSAAALTSQFRAAYNFRGNASAARRNYDILILQIDAPRP